MKLCQNCTHYTAYYRKWSGGYSRLNNGFCSQNKKPQTLFETCDNFKSDEQKEKRREDMRLTALEQALTSINEIAHILKEKNS